jgi:hypothetical protein
VTQVRHTVVGMSLEEQDALGHGAGFRRRGDPYRRAVPEP